MSLVSHLIPSSFYLFYRTTGKHFVIDNLSDRETRIELNHIVLRGDTDVPDI
jgi:hypothetical protein